MTNKERKVILNSKNFGYIANSARVLSILALTGLLVLGGCDFYDDDVGSGPADRNYSTTYTGTIEAITGPITSLTVHHDYDPGATGPTSATVNCSNGLTLTGQISGNRLVAYGNGHAGQPGYDGGYVLGR